MPHLTGEDILRMWEGGRNEHPLERALVILGVAFPDSSAHQLASLSVAERDVKLFAVRTRLFGPLMRCRGTCSKCSEELEFTLNAEDILANSPGTDLTTSPFEADGITVRYRLPSSYDLASAAQTGNNASARAELLKSCVLEVMNEEGPVSDTIIRENAVVALEKHLSESNFILDPIVELTCPVCKATSTSVFDVVGFLWREISAAARRLLLEIHTLASVYGWSEREILRMSEGRRQIYLEMAGS